MKRPWISGALGTLAALLVAGALTWSPAAARPEGETPQTKDKDKPKTQEDLANEALTVQGVVLDAFWVPAKKAGQWTASIKIWSDEADREITVYGDDISVRDAIVSGTVCVGRNAIAYGDRDDRDVLIGRTITVPYPDQPCTATIPSKPPS